MFSSRISLRVRYAETDRMGYVYYGNYAQYFEVARVECLRSLGFTYKKIEDDGITLPVFHYEVKFFKPAYYDDELTIVTKVRELPLARIIFDYETFNSKNELLNRASTTLVFIDSKKARPCKAPNELVEMLKKYF